MHGILRRLLVGALLVGGVAYFAVFRDDSSREGLLIWDPTDPESTEELRQRTEDLRDPSELGPGDPANFPTQPAEIARPQVARGRVVRFDDTPIPNVEVLRTHPYLDLLRERTDSDGRFEFRLQSGRGQFALDDDAWVSLGGRNMLEEEANVEYVIVAAPRGRVQGRVVDEHGVGVADASVRLSPPSNALVPFGLVTPPAEDESWAVWSSAEGGFRFERAPDMPGVVIHVDHPRYSTTAAPVRFEDGRAQLQIELKPPE